MYYFVKNWSDVVFACAIVDTNFDFALAELNDVFHKHNYARILLIPRQIHKLYRHLAGCIFYYDIRNRICVKSLIVTCSYVKLNKAIDVPTTTQTATLVYRATCTQLVLKKYFGNRGNAIRVWRFAHRRGRPQVKLQLLYFFQYDVTRSLIKIIFLVRHQQHVLFIWSARSYDF